MPKTGQPLQSGDGSEEESPGGLDEVGRRMLLMLGSETTATIHLCSSSMSLLLERVF